MLSIRPHTREECGVVRKIHETLSPMRCFKVQVKGSSSALVVDKCVCMFVCVRAIDSKRLEIKLPPPALQGASSTQQLHGTLGGLYMHFLKSPFSFYSLAVYKCPQLRMRSIITLCNSCFVLLLCPSSAAIDSRNLA